ncbi:Efflux pump azaL [Hypsizygus marmoreus]|uniref:Efflux pump azaL n=1 Tax=Hypsizygus marmoreus TaxID=39966 RepID=A0A369JU97_HYPMA|nr:Efflux pump azaL [Hypsizygus marmoreus]
MDDPIIDVDEATYLLSRPPSIKGHRELTPLPWLQIMIALSLDACEAITIQSIYPYINQLVSELDIVGGDDRKVGYYAGLIESLFYLTEALTILQWSRISDHIGRKPVMLIGLVASRCICGLLDGNIGVVKSVLGELTDSSNRAEGFALLPVVWAIGATLGPMIGGSLSRPHERFPDLFGGIFWRDHPYFLPCATTASVVFATFAITLLLFKETAPNRKRHPTSTPESPLQSSHAPSAPVALRHILTYPVLLSVSNYMSLAFLKISLNTLLPLFLAMPLAIGGLGFSPATIGYILSLHGAFAGIFQAFYFARIVRRLGARRVFVWGIATFVGIFAALPVIGLYARNCVDAGMDGGESTADGVVWMAIGCVLIMMTFMDMAFGCVFMYVTASAPDAHSLGATNGLSQTTVSITRAVGPAFASSLFSVSVQHNLLHGYAAFAIMATLACAATVLAMQLPDM